MLKSSLLFVFLTFIASDHIILGSRIPKERIVDGDLAEIEDFPFIVALKVYNQEEKGFLCGGSLIGPRTVLTAAHCVIDDDNIPVKKIHVRAGSKNRSNGGILAYEFKTIRHPNYDSNAKNKDLGDYDIAIIELDREVIGQGLKTAIIEMWDENVQFAPDTSCWIAGWGRLVASDSSVPYLLEKRKIFVSDNPFCLGKNEYKICTSDPYGGTCSGDSGGPLIINGKLAGITSTGDKSSCHSTAYTSVPAFRNWIRENSGI